MDREAKTIVRVLKNKYQDKNEVSFFRDEASLGLDEFEKFLLTGPMSSAGYVLDIGCGVGREAIALAKLGFKVKAVDIAPAMIEAAKEKAQEEGVAVDFEVLDVTELEYKNTFDYCIFSSGVYNSIPSKKLRLLMIFRLIGSLKPKSKIFLPIGMSRHPKIISRSRWVDFMRRLFYQFEYGDTFIKQVSLNTKSKTPVFFHNFYSFSQIEKELSESGFYVRKLLPGLWQVSKEPDEEVRFLTSQKNALLLDTFQKIKKEFSLSGIGLWGLKGIYMTFNEYPDPSYRPMVDIDILIKKSSVAQAAEILVNLGFKEISSLTQRSYGCDATFMDERKLYVDLHWDLCQYERFKGVINITDDFLKRAEGNYLAKEDHLLYIALHYALIDGLKSDNGRRDLEILVKNNPDLNFKEILLRAKNYGIRQVLYYALPDKFRSCRPGPAKRCILDFLLSRDYFWARFLAQVLIFDWPNDSLKVFFKSFKKFFRPKRSKKMSMLL